MRRLFMVLLFLLPLSAVSQPYMTAYKPRLVIFVIHGFLGGPSTFCDLEQILEHQLGYGIEVEHLTYPTDGFSDSSLDDPGHRDNVSVASFTRKIYEDISTYFTTNMYPTDTPYAIITHSQGGLIATRLLLDCYQKDVAYCKENLKKTKLDYALPENLTHVFTIMTPFWGSPTATFAKEQSFYRWFLPDEQLRNLSMGSDFVTYNRSLLMESHQNNYEILKRPEIVNIAANASSTWLGSLIRTISDLPQNNTLESDIVVPIPSARMDFFYYDYTGEKIKTGKTQYADYFYSLNGNHMNVPMSEKGLACVSWDNHLKTPIFPIIRKHLQPLLGLPDRASTVEVFKDQSIFPPNVESFILEVQLEIPKDIPKIYHFDPKNVVIESREGDRTLLYKLHRKNDWMSTYLGFNQDEQQKKSYVTYFTTGTFLKEFSYVIDRNYKTEDYTSEETLDITVNVPWFKTQKIEAKVSPSYTTYVKLKLEPKVQQFLPTVHVNDGADGALSVMQVKNKWHVISYSDKTKKFTQHQYDNLPFEHSYQSRNVCYEAMMAKEKALTLSYYPEYNSTKPFHHINVQHNFHVFGRVTGGKKRRDGLYELDRVFVTSYDLVGFVGGYWPHRYLEDKLAGMWIDTRDVRIINKCSK